MHVLRSRRGDAVTATFMNWDRAAGVEATIDVARYIPKRSRLGAYIVTQDTLPAALQADAGEDGTYTIRVPESPVSAVLERSSRQLITDRSEGRRKQLVAPAP